MSHYSTSSKPQSALKSAVQLQKMTNMIHLVPSNLYLDTWDWMFWMTEDDRRWVKHCQEMSSTSQHIQLNKHLLNWTKWPRSQRGQSKVSHRSAAPLIRTAWHCGLGLVGCASESGKVFEWAAKHVPTWNTDRVLILGSRTAQQVQQKSWKNNLKKVKMLFFHEYNIYIYNIILYKMQNLKSTLTNCRS